MLMAFYKLNGQLVEYLGILMSYSGTYLSFGMNLCLTTITFIIDVVEHSISSTSLIDLLVPHK